jgi:hypothetical protein
MRRNCGAYSIIFVGNCYKKSKDYIVCNKWNRCIYACLSVQLQSPYALSYATESDSFATEPVSLLWSEDWILSDPEFAPYVNCSVDCCSEGEISFFDEEMRSVTDINSSLV